MSPFSCSGVARQLASVAPIDAAKEKWQTRLGNPDRRVALPNVRPRWLVSENDRTPLRRVAALTGAGFGRHPAPALMDSAAHRRSPARTGRASPSPGPFRLPARPGSTANPRGGAKRAGRRSLASIAALATQKRLPWAAEKVTVTICATHPSARSGKWWLSPFRRPFDRQTRSGPRPEKVSRELGTFLAPYGRAGDCGWPAAACVAAAGPIGSAGTLGS